MGSGARFPEVDIGGFSWMCLPRLSIKFGMVKMASSIPASVISATNHSQQISISTLQYPHNIGKRGTCISQSRIPIRPTRKTAVLNIGPPSEPACCTSLINGGQIHGGGLISGPSVVYC